MFCRTRGARVLVNDLGGGVDGSALPQYDVQERLRTNGMEAGHNTPEEYNRFIAQEIAKYTKVVKDGNIRVE